MTIKLEPYLDFNGNAEEAFAFYQIVFGGEVTSLIRFRDMPMSGVTIPEGDAGKSCTSACRLAKTS